MNDRMRITITSTEHKEIVLQLMGECGLNATQTILKLIKDNRPKVVKNDKNIQTNK